MLVAGGQDFCGWGGVVVGSNGAGGSLIVAQIRRKGYGRLSVAGVVYVREELLVLRPIGVAAGEDE